MGRSAGKARRAWTPKDEAYRLWMVAGVKLPGKSQKGLAAAAKLGQSAVSKLLGGTRFLSLGEIDAIADYFGSGHPPPNGEAPKAKGGVVREREAPPQLSVEAIIAPGYWSRMGGAVSTAAQRTPIAGRLDPKYAGISQYACAFQSDPSQYVVCAPFAAVRAAPLPGDKVHVRRTRENGEYEDTIRVVTISGGRTTLVLQEAPDDDKDKVMVYPSRRSGESVELRGLVIGRFIAED